LLLVEVLLLGLPADPTQGDPDVLHRTLRYAREAVELIPETDRNHHSAREILTQALLARFVTVRNVDELTDTLRHIGALPGDPNVWVPEILSIMRIAHTGR
jgi:hypothetical protein